MIGPPLWGTGVLRDPFPAKGQKDRNSLIGSKPRPEYAALYGLGQELTDRS